MGNILINAPAMVSQINGDDLQCESQQSLYLHVVPVAQEFQMVSLAALVNMFSLFLPLSVNDSSECIPCDSQERLWSSSGIIDKYTVEFEHNNVLCPNTIKL